MPPSEVTRVFFILPMFEEPFIPVMTRYTMLQRNLLYTGVARGERLVVLIGQRKAVAIAVHNVSGRRRWSKLKEWLGASV
jgi:exodeoxyribonuclease V alpha subunit